MDEVKLNEIVQYFKILVSQEQHEPHFISLLQCNFDISQNKI